MKRYFLNTTWEAPQYFTAEPVGHQLYLERGEPAKEGMRWVEQYESAEECQQHADRWISEEMDMGYAETTADDPAVATVAASVLAGLPPLQLLPEKVWGQRIKLAHFTWYRLGSCEEVARLLTQHGATVLEEQSATEFDFYLGGMALMSGETFERPVLFEEELCAPLPLAEGLAWFKPRLWGMLRELLAHPAVVVNQFSLGLPAAEEELAQHEATLGRPLPQLLREFYQQVGELKLLWAYRAKDVTPGNGGFNIDEDDAHDGDINIWPLAEVLAGEWTDQDYGYTKALQENQKLFDFYSEYYQMAVELGDEADPLLHLGNDYGASFDDDKPVRFSDYLSLLLHTYGFKERERLFNHRLTPGGQLEAPAATALQGLATLDLTNPFHKDLDVPRSFASRDDDDYAPDDEADEALPAAAGDEAPAAAPIDLPVSEPLDSMAAGRPQVAFVAFESPFPITDSAHKAAFAVANPGRTPLTVLGYVAELVATAPGQEVVLGTDDSATHRDPLQGYTHVSNGMFLFFNASAGLCIEPLHLSAMPVLVPAGHRTTIHLYLHNLDLLAAGLGAAASYHLRVAVQLADGEVLRAQQPIAVSA